MRNKFFFFVLLLPAFAFSSNEDTLTIEEFLSMVNQHHPVTYQINNNLKKANYLVNEAKGGFEPILNANFNRKSFEDKDYYQKFQSSLEIPIWFGLSAETGFEIVS